MPSSSAADDYLNALKVDSRKKQMQTQAKLQGKPVPPVDGPLLSASPPVEEKVAPPEEVSLPLGLHTQSMAWLRILGLCVVRVCTGFFFCCRRAGCILTFGAVVADPLTNCF